jgi:TrmH family RNA methyltransferase
VRHLTDAQYSSVSLSQSPQGLLAVVRLPQGCYTEELPKNPGSKILLLEHIQDPGNIGTLVRSAVAFNFSGVILSSKCADPFSPKAVQSSAGSVCSIWIRRVDTYLQLATSLKTQEYAVCAADIRGEPHIDFSIHNRHIIALGNEGAGLTEDLLSLSDVKFCIPFNASRIESLNVAVSGAIAMFCSGIGVKM